MKQDLTPLGFQYPQRRSGPDSAVTDSAVTDELPRLPQFSIRTLMLLVAACGLLFGLMRLIGPVWSTIVAWFVVLAAAHVSANAWGTWLKRRKQHPEDKPEGALLSAASGPRFAPATRLRLHSSLGRAMIYASGGGAVVGAVLGSYLLLMANWGRVGVFGLLLGTLSTAVIGGFLGFLASSFIDVFGRAWKEALQEASPSQQKQDRRPTQAAAPLTGQRPDDGSPGPAHQ